jgi:hypothetical protein
MALLCEHFSKIVAIFQVYYFSSHLGHITWHNAQVLYFFDFFWISHIDFKVWPKWRAWPLLGRDRILRNSWWISYEIDTCVSKNDFWKKVWANYEAPVVQNWPASNWIGGYLSISWGVAIKPFPCKQMGIVHKIWYSII